MKIIAVYYLCAAIAYLVIGCWLSFRLPDWLDMTPLENDICVGLIVLSYPIFLLSGATKISSAIYNKIHGRRL